MNSNFNKSAYGQDGEPIRFIKGKGFNPVTGDLIVRTADDRPSYYVSPLAAESPDYDYELLRRNPPDKKLMPVTIHTAQQMKELADKLKAQADTPPDIWKPSFSRAEARRNLEDLILGYPEKKTYNAGNESALLAKVLGRPIGGISDVDGDGDGFVTGPTGEDNVPAPAAAIKPNISKPSMPSVSPKPADGETPATPAEHLKSILGKIGRRRKPFRLLDARDTRKTIEELVSDDAKALVAGEMPQQSLFRIRDNARAKLHVLGEQHLDAVLAKLPLEQIQALEKERVETRRVLDAAEAELEEFMRNSPIMRLWVANQGQDGMPGMRYPIENFGQTRDQVLKAMLVTQIAEDMRKLGVTDDDARHVIERLGAIVKNSAEQNQKNHKERFGDEISPIVLLADELVKQWARTANDNATPSLVTQIIARQLLPQLHGLGDEYAQHEKIFKSEAARNAYALAADLVADPIVAKTVTAALQSQWARTQEQLARLAPDGKVTVFRGFGSEAARREVVEQLRARGEWEHDDHVSDIYDKVNDAEGIIDAAQEVQQEQFDLKNEAIQLREEMDDHIEQAQELIEELADIDDSTDERASEIQYELEELRTRYERALNRHEEIRSTIEDNQERINELVTEWNNTQAEMEEIQNDAEDSMDNENASAKLNVQGLPLASYATTQKIANDFARKEGGVVFWDEVPISTVLSTTCTGFGCFLEDEFVVSHPLIRGANAVVPPAPEELEALSDEWGDIAGQTLDNYVALDSVDVEDPPDFPDPDYD